MMSRDQDSEELIVTAKDLFRLNVDACDQMYAAGILKTSDHVRLQEGILIQDPFLQVGRECLLTADGPYYRLTVAQYHECVRVGIIRNEHRVELLDGLLVTKCAD